MSVATQSEETMQLTLTLPKVVAQHLHDQVATGLYANEREYVESILLSETLFDPIDESVLTHWINTEGVRRLRAMEANPESALTAKEVFDFLEDDAVGSEVA